MNRNEFISSIMEQFNCTAAEARAAEVREWAENTAPVTFVRNWWRAQARPIDPDLNASSVKHIQAQWGIFVQALLDRPTVYGGDFIGIVEGKNPPTEEAVAAMVAEWENSGE